MKKAEYSTQEIRAMLDHLSGVYDLTRVVDPTECRVLGIDQDGHINRDERCYSVWKSNQRCANCTSAGACKTGCPVGKSEHFNNQIFDIKSNPVTLRMNDGSCFDAVVELISIRDEDPSADENVNDREAENVDNQAFRYQASHDSLTRLLNADIFYEQVRAKLLESPDLPWVIVTGNIMDFRLINNLFGVERGNEVLVKTAEVLQEITEDENGLCARINADNFALLLLKDNSLDETLKQAAYAMANFCTSGIFTLRIHFGVYEPRDVSVPVSVMCDRANIALRTIKREIRCIVAYFDEKMMQRLLFEQEIISLFGKELKEGRIKMYLQPLVNKNGVSVSAEALVRWIRPDGTFLNPGDFIEILEQAGLIVELDQCIWEQAAKQLSLWKNTEYDNLTISVNMSARDFYDCDLYTVFTDLIKKYDLDSRKLHLEITETTLLKSSERNKKIIDKLREEGFLIEIDDFGKGYSSLSMLKDIHADILKIDMGFLRDMEKTDRSRIILGSVISMAESLNMEVVTEGVETEQQMKMLSDMGCHIFQGYYFSRPVPVEGFEEKYRVEK